MSVYVCAVGYMRRTYELVDAEQLLARLRQVHRRDPHLPLPAIGHAVLAQRTRDDLMAKAYSWARARSVPITIALQQRGFAGRCTRALQHCSTATPSRTQPATHR